MLRLTEDRCREPQFSGSTSRPTKPGVKGEALAEARRRSELSIHAIRACCWARVGYLRELLCLLRRVPRFKPNPFSTCICSRIICASSTAYTMSSSRPSTTAAGSTADCRWASPLPRAEAVGLKISSKDIPLSLLCLTFGRLLYAASLGTVAAMLILAFVSLIASPHDGLPIAARTIRAFAMVVPLLALMFAFAVWSLDGEASAAVMPRAAVLASGSFVVVTSFALLPLERLRLQLRASRARALYRGRGRRSRLGIGRSLGALSSPACARRHRSSPRLWVRRDTQRHSYGSGASRVVAVR